MKTTKMEARIVSLTFLVFMFLIFLSAISSKNMLDILYVALIIFYMSRLIYVKILDEDDDVNDSY